GGDPTIQTRWIVNHAFECSGTFTSVCADPPPYSFDFASGPGTFNGATNLDLAPGSSTHFLFGTFNPAGPAPAGTYAFYNAIFEFEFYDPDNTDPDVHPQGLTIATTCERQNDACAFTRTVAAIPEPATWAMLVLGFGGIGAMLRGGRRREALVRA
ncbi:MAG: sorting protein, partial [Phenylobacterium sp.]|nr:sorting protein [Phenylobacterium sp.]